MCAERYVFSLRNPRLTSCIGQDGRRSKEKRNTYCPTAKDNSLIPGFKRIWRDRVNGFGNQTHHIVGIVVKLAFHQIGEHGCLRMPTFMSSNSHSSSRPGEARYSNKSRNRGIGSCGSLRVRSVLRYSQSHATILSSLP